MAVWPGANGEGGGEAGREGSPPTGDLLQRKEGEGESCQVGRESLSKFYLLYLLIWMHEIRRVWPSSATSPRRRSPFVLSEHKKSGRKWHAGK